VRGEFLREEGGFTLPELMVTMVMMLTVLFALYSIFDMSLRVFTSAATRWRPSRTPGWDWRRWSGS
jgi:prepilin-type N-terminal cleavage/methylation domain-containing protein